MEMAAVNSPAAAFVAGLITSLHCVGMCGPLACALMPVRKDQGDPMAVTCGNAVAGIATDTGRYGPTWYKADRHPKDTGSFGKLCRPPSDTSDELGCRNHENNQFLVWAYGVGYYTGCGANGACHTFFVEE